MKKLLIFAFLILCVFFAITNYSSSNASEREEKIIVGEKEILLTEANNSFGLDLFKMITTKFPDSNTCISPYSIASALSMTYNGARTTTKAQMGEVLNYNGLNLEDINSSYKVLNNHFITQTDSFTLEIANSIWYKDSFPVADNFIDINKSYFDAEIKQLSFDDGSYIEVINRWVNDKTHGKIERILKAPVDPLAVMYLINAIYFLADWSSPFDTARTTEQKFYINPDSSMDAEFMNKEGRFHYCKSEKYQAIELYYKDLQYKMLLLLPDTSYNANSLIDDLSNDNLSECLNNMSPPLVNIYLPKFVMKFEGSLVDDLENLGMIEAFNHKADFSGMFESGRSDSLYISDVIHKTFIKVDEKGTEAAAATAVVVKYTATPVMDETIVLKFNRPFVFALMESQTNSIIFIGKVQRPDWEEEI